MATLKKKARLRHTSCLGQSCDFFDAVHPSYNNLLNLIDIITIFCINHRREVESGLSGPAHSRLKFESDLIGRII